MGKEEGREGKWLFSLVVVSHPVLVLELNLSPRKSSTSSQPLSRLCHMALFFYLKKQTNKQKRPKKTKKKEKKKEKNRKTTTKITLLIINGKKQVCSGESSILTSGQCYHH